MPRPLAPLRSAVTVTVVSATRIDLAWAAGASAPAETAYRLRCSVDPEFRTGVVQQLVRLNTVAGRQVQWGGLNQGAAHHFELRAVNADGVSDPLRFSAATPAAGSWPGPAPAVTMEPPLLVVPAAILDWFDPTGLPGFPARNLARPSPQLTWRSESGAPQAAFLTSGEPVDTLALLGTSAAEAATWTIRAGPTLASVSPGGTPAHTLGPQPFRASSGLPARPGYHGLARFAPQTQPWWSVEVAHGGPQFVASHLVLGRARLASKNWSQDASEEGEDSGSIEWTRDGALDQRAGLRLRAASLDVSFLAEGEHEALYGDLWWRTGATSPVLYVPNSRAGAHLHDRMLYGPIVRSGRRVGINSRMTRSFEVRSIV